MRQSPGRTAIALTIAGSDSSGGAGIQADLKTFTALGVYGACVITALTAQNTRGVEGVEATRPQFVLAQLNSVLSDLDVGAIKTGMLANGAIITTVARRLREVTASGRPMPLIVDPVMVATSGDVLLAADAIDAIGQELAPLATLLTPNLAEAARLLGAVEADSEAAAAAQAKALFARFGCPILLKGGHGSGSDALDFYFAGSDLVRLSRPRLDTPIPMAPVACSPPPWPRCWRGAWACARPSPAPRPLSGRASRPAPTSALARAGARWIASLASAGAPSD